MSRTTVPLALLAISAAAHAQVWNEAGDASALPPGQATVGPGPLAQINGVLAAGDVDLYCISITNPGAFSATTTGGAGFDTQLWLFDAAGMGVAHNDDNPAGGLQSRLTGLFVPGPGVYLLGISAYDRDPLNGAGLPMWLDTPFNTERAPDGPGGPGPLAAWDAGAAPGSGPYSIFLTGAAFCMVPSPGALSLLGVGGVLIARRRR